MLTEICQYLKNYFDYKRCIGDIEISDGVITCNGAEVELEDGQHFALFRDRFVLGVYKQGDEIADKTFKGAVWLMDIPDAVLNADKWATEWLAKNGGADSENNSSFQSESFGGYSYSKGSNSAGKVGASIFDNAQFASMLAPFRKIR